MWNRWLSLATKKHLPRENEQFLPEMVLTDHNADSHVSTTQSKFLWSLIAQTVSKSTMVQLAKKIGNTLCKFPFPFRNPILQLTNFSFIPCPKWYTCYLNASQWVNVVTQNDRSTWKAYNPIFMRLSQENRRQVVAFSPALKTCFWYCACIYYPQMTEIQDLN